MSKESFDFWLLALFWKGQFLLNWGLDYLVSRFLDLCEPFLIQLEDMRHR